MRHRRFHAIVTVAGGADARDNWILYQKIGWELWGAGFMESMPGRWRGADLSGDEVDDLVFRVKHIQRAHRGFAVAIIVLWFFDEYRIKRVFVLP